MRRLIRFEDAYGMADLVCMTQDLGLITLISNNDSLLGVNENNASSSIKTKHLRHYINKNEIEEALLDTLEQFPKSINKRVIKWIISGDIRDSFIMEVLYGTSYS